MPPRFDPVVSIVGFHHAKGPEIEHWIGVEDETTLSEWPLLPFMALSDGAHSSSEDFSYFTLKHIVHKPDGSIDRPISLFGISCTRQLDASTLIDRPADVTRSTVQKAVVVIADSPVYFGSLKEKLGMVTKAWFAQRNFEDLDIIRKFQESLKTSLSDDNSDREQYLGLSLRELVYEFRQQTLVLFKCCLLQPKMLFFASRCDRLCMTQFSLLSLIPGLLRALEDCADPELNYYEASLYKPTSVKTSDRKSLLKFMGMPLQIFGKGSLFGPYTPLQQLDILADVGTKSYIVGSTNSLLLQQKDRYSDILINLDERTVNITSTSLRSALYLTAADRRWIDSIVQSVTDSWDENDPSRPKTMGFVGSEEYIRLQFEEYILAMVSSVKCHDFLQLHAGSASRILPDVDGDPAYDFGMDFIDMWKRTENYRIFQKFTDSELFDLVPPKHLMAGGLSMDDVSRRISQQLNDLKLDEKMVNGREVVAKTLVAGRGKIGAAFSTLTNNVAQYREAQAQKLKQQETKSPAPSIAPSIDSNEAAPSEKFGEQPAPAPQPVKGYFASWASWAGEKKRKAFGTTPVQTPNSSPPLKPTASEDHTTSAASSIGSPKAARNSYGDDIYDAETGLGKGDSGVISPPSRESLDMQTQAQKMSMESEPNEQPKRGFGFFSKLTERFVDPRKSLPAPPPPEKETQPSTPTKDSAKEPEVPERSDEDREFLRNLRKSLPPPPSEIDDLPIRHDLVPAPGALVAQEVFDDPVMVEKPLPRTDTEKTFTGKEETEVSPQATNPPEELGPSSIQEYHDAEQPAVLAKLEAQPSRPAAEIGTQASSTTSSPASSTRFKARNIIRQYVAQENEAELLKGEGSKAENFKAGEVKLPVNSIDGVTNEEQKIAKRKSRKSLIADKRLDGMTESIKAEQPMVEEPQVEAAPVAELSTEQKIAKRRSRRSIVGQMPAEEEIKSDTFQAKEPTMEEKITKRKSRRSLYSENAPLQPSADGSKETAIEESTIEQKIAKRRSRRSTIVDKAVERQVESIKMDDARSDMASSQAQELETASPTMDADEEPKIVVKKYRKSQAVNKPVDQDIGKQNDSLLPESKADFKEPSIKELQAEAPKAEESRATRLKAKGLLRKYMAQEQETEQRSHVESPMDGERAIDEAQIPAPIEEVKIEEVNNPEQHSEVPSAVRLKARGLLRKYVAQEQEAEQKSKAATPNTEEQTIEESAPKPTRRRGTMASSRPGPMVATADAAALESPTPGIFRRKTIPVPPSSPPPAESKSETSSEVFDTPRRLRRKSLRAPSPAPATPKTEESTEAVPAPSTPGTPATSETSSSIKRRSIRAVAPDSNLEAKLQDSPKPSPFEAPPPLVKRKTIPAVFAQADAEVAAAAQKSGESPKRSPHRTPSPSNGPATTAATAATRAISSRSRSGTILNSPTGFSLNKTASPPLLTLSSFKDLQKKAEVGAKTPSPTKDSPSLPADRPRSPFIKTAVAGMKSPTLDDSPLSPGQAAVAESRSGPGRIGSGLKNNPFLKNDGVLSPTGEMETAGRKRVGTLKNNPFIKNDLKSPTSPPPAGGK